MANGYKEVFIPIVQPFPDLPMLRINGIDVFLIPPDNVTREDNRVVATYGDYEQVITADGEGDERHNFASVTRRRS